MSNSLEIFEQFVRKKSPSSQRAGNNAVIYTRVSTREQAENNQSLETQKKACEKFAEKNGYNIISYFGGTYESAKSDERQEFKRMLDYVKQSKQLISYIIVYSVDRFSRSGANAIYIASELKKQGIMVVAVSQPTDTQTSSGSLQQNIQFIFSQYDNDLRREKCMAGVKEKLLKGYWPHKAPLGYDQYNKGKEQNIVVNEKGKLLRKAFQWKAEGMSSTEITARLKAVGIYLPPQTLSDLFRNPFYCGLLTHNMLDGKVIEGNHEKLISKELFLRVNGALAKNAQNYKHSTGNEEIPLKHFVRCGECGTPFVGYIVKAKRIYYYKCNKIGCKCNRNAKKMNELFHDHLKFYKIDEKFFAPLMVHLKRSFNKMNETNIEISKDLLAQLNEVEKKIEMLEEKFILGEVNKELYEKFFQKYKVEKKKINEELQKTDFKLSNLDNYINKSLELAVNLDSLWKKGTLSIKEKLQNLLFPEGIFYDRKNDSYRTSRINTIFLLISSLSEAIKNKKAGQAKGFFDLSGLVVMGGIVTSYFYIYPPYQNYIIYSKLTF